MNGTELSTPSKAADNSKKRELSSPFSPEDKILKKTKPSMSGNNSMDGAEGSMDAETAFMSQTHMLTLPETELHKISELIMPSVQTETLMAIRNDLKSLIKDAVTEALDNKLADLRSENKRISAENTALKDRVGKLEQQMDDAEQYSRRNCLRLSNIPETNTEQTDQIVLKVADTININMSPGQVASYR